MFRGMLLAVAAAAVAVGFGAVPAEADTGLVPPTDWTARFDPASVPQPADGARALDAAASLTPTVEPVAVTDAELATVGASGSAPAIATPALFIVDNDRVECPNADFTSITAAAAAAPPGATIRVCPGRYEESVPVLKDALTLVAPRHQGQASQCPNDAADDPTNYAIVDPPTGTNGFTIAANGVVLDGFVVTNTTGLGSSGIVTSPLHSGYVVQHNVVQDNGYFGVQWRSSGAVASVFSHNCVRHQNVVPPAGPGNFREGLRVDRASNSTIENNEFDDNFQAVDLIDCFCSSMDVVHNDFVSNFVAVPIGDSFNGFFQPQLTNGLIAYNHFVGNTNGAVNLIVGVTDTDIAYNLVEGPAIWGMSLEGSNQNTVIEQNHIRGTDLFGIFVHDGTGHLVQNNLVEDNGNTGILLTQNANGNTIRENHVLDNGFYGIRANGPGAQASGNTIERNKAIGNGFVDCSDGSVGAGTSGTANLWIDDLGKTEDRPGLCTKPQTP